tara:strand:+ start:498 stop:647 length:150 start_codon:yes stop_codon:yes gene_type:complete
MDDDLFEQNVMALVDYAERLDLYITSIDWEGEPVAIYVAPLELEEEEAA